MGERIFAREGRGGNELVVTPGWVIAHGAGGLSRGRCEKKLPLSAKFDEYDG